MYYNICSHILEFAQSISHSLGNSWQLFRTATVAFVSATWFTVFHSGTIILI